MEGSKGKELYINFDEYIRQGEPDKREKAGYWQTAIGLQAVDGLTVSNYLLELARRNIEGELTMDEVHILLDAYYEEKHKQRAKWAEYDTFTRIDMHPNQKDSKMGRPI